MNAKEARKIVMDNTTDFNSCLESIYNQIKQNAQNSECYLIIKNEIHLKWFTVHPYLITKLRDDGYDVEDLTKIGGSITIRW